MKNNFKAGDRVEHMKIGCSGIIEHADDSHVRVRWDDGQVGMLFFERGIVPCAAYLERKVLEEDKQ